MLGYFPVPLSLLFQRDTSSVIVFVSLPSQRKTKKQQLQADPGRGPAPSAAVSCCFGSGPALGEAPALTPRGEGRRGAARATPAGDTAAAGPRAPARPSPAPLSHPRQPRGSRPPQPCAGGEAGNTREPRPPPCPQPRCSQAPRTPCVLRGSPPRGSRSAGNPRRGRQSWARLPRRRARGRGGERPRAGSGPTLFVSVGVSGPLGPEAARAAETRGGL